MGISPIILFTLHVGWIHPPHIMVGKPTLRDKEVNSIAQSQPYHQIKQFPTPNCP